LRYQIKGLDCPNCAAKIERGLRQIQGLQNATVNFALKSIELPEEMLNEAQRVVAALEPEARIVSLDEENEIEDRFQIPVMIVAGTLLLIGVLFHQRLHDTTYSWAEYAVLLPSYLLVGWPVIRKAVRNLTRGELFDENTLMAIATLGAIAIHQLPEAAGVMVFYSVGEYLQDRSVNRSRRSIAALLDIRPEFANLKDSDGTCQVRPEEVNPGDIIIVKPGERVPLDGEVLEGDSFVDTSALTGESVPRQLSPGKTILAGMVNGQGLLTVKVTKEFGQSSVSRILELVQNAASRKAPTEQFITSFSRYYTPAVVFGALAVAILPPLLVPGQTFSVWVYRALVMLVISCPCALVISVPLGYFGGIGGASRKGVLVKGGNYLDALAETHTVVFDKTGTLTKGVFKVSKIVPAEGFSEEEVLEYAAAAEAFSSHPIAQSIRQEYGKDVPQHKIQNYKDVAGLGVSASFNGKQILAGKDSLLEQAGISHDQCNAEGTVVYIAVDGHYAGCIDIADEIREDAQTAIAGLKKLGVQKIAMLTGDKESVAETIARSLDLDGFYPELLPEDKVEKVEKMKSVMPNPKKNKLVFVGDGINDAPVIARADVGIAMGGLGSDAAIEAADVVLMEDAPSKLATVISISRWTRRIVRQNVVFALAVKSIFLILGSFGVASIWEAVFADVGVALLAVFNATRTLRYSGD
jgi:Cd2+/Zn2+-exporting ATPase